MLRISKKPRGGQNVLNINQNCRRKKKRKKPTQNKTKQPHTHKRTKSSCCYFMKMLFLKWELSLDSDDMWILDVPPCQCVIDALFPSGHIDQTVQVEIVLQ